MLRKWVLRIIAITLLAGGVVRLFANAAVFEAFGIGEIWLGTPYSLYIYRVLAGFVILSGILIWIISRAPERYRTLLKGCAWGFDIIGILMVVAGITSGLPHRYYLADPAYCFIVAILLWYSAKPTRGTDPAPGVSGSPR
jgi:hypothetical protein